MECMHIEVEDLHPSIYKMCIDRATYTVSSRMPPEIYFGQGKTHCSSSFGFKEEHGRSYSCYILPVTFPVRIDKTLIHTLLAIIATGSLQEILNFLVQDTAWVSQSKTGKIADLVYRRYRILSKTHCISSVHFPSASSSPYQFRLNPSYMYNIAKQVLRYSFSLSLTSAS